MFHHSELANEVSIGFVSTGKASENQFHHYVSENDHYEIFSSAEDLWTNQESKISCPRKVYQDILTKIQQGVLTAEYEVVKKAIKGHDIEDLFKRINHIMHEGAFCTLIFSNGDDRHTVPKLDALTEENCWSYDFNSERDLRIFLEGLAFPSIETEYYFIKNGVITKKSA